MSFKIKKYLTINTVLLLIVIAIAIFFRFYNTPGRYGFDYDPTRDALVTDYGAQTLQFPLIGPPSGIGPFTFGPWYYYQLIIFKIIFPVAYSPWIYIGILSTISVLIMYKIGVLLGGRKMGLILGALAALSPAETGQIRALSNPTLVPVYATLTIWIFIKFVKENPSLWMATLWGLILGIGINNHFQAIGLLPLPILFFVYKKERRLSRILSFIVGLVISFAPLLIFNLSHGWSTVVGLFSYIFQGSGSLYVPNRWIFYIGNFWPVFLAYVLGLPSQVGFLAGLCMGFAILYLLIKKKLSIIYISILLTFVINILVLRYFPGKLEYYYLLFLHPFIFIFFGLVILQLFNQKYGKYLGIFIIVLVLIGMVGQSVDRLAPASDQKLFREEAQTLIKDYPNNKFVFYECSDSQKNRIRGIVFFMNLNNKLSQNGVQIVFPSEKCLLTASARNLNNINAFDVSFVSEESLSKLGWRMVTPKTVFQQLSRNTF
jgi:4-amino-4-deoxy-L-arabinose transferase-like glycosyltransferase